jgi:hypothetical protein
MEQSGWCGGAASGSVIDAIAELCVFVLANPWGHHVPGIDRYVVT